ncbi:MAG TPA: NUDIX hydrolase [Myxococcales bacterium]|jgi:8-oxo-dGTP pyrophosphatase MutT (NUDIX family)
MSGIKPWDWRSGRLLADCRIFKLRSETFRSPATGQDHDFYVLESGDWVNVIPFTDAGELVLVRQYRVGRREMSLEIPGGMVDPGEAPEKAAARELLEETGYAPRELRSLGSIDSNPAILNNLTHSYLALGCEPKAATHFDSTEEVELVKVPPARIDELLRTGEIRHPLVAVAFLHWKLRGSPTR